MKILDWLKSEETLKKEKVLKEEKEYKDKLCNLFASIKNRIISVDSLKVPTDSNWFLSDRQSDKRLQPYRFNTSNRHIPISSRLETDIKIVLETDIKNFIESLNSQLSVGDVIFIRDNVDYPFVLMIDFENHLYNFRLDYSILDFNGDNKILKEYEQNELEDIMKDFTVEVEYKPEIINDKLVKALKENDSKRIEM